MNLILRLIAGGVLAACLPLPEATAQPATACSQAAHFIDVSKGSAGPRYAKPELQVSCTDEHVVVQSNGIPNFEFVAITPNPLQTQRYTWRIPRNPKPSPNPQQVPLLGPTAVMVNGLPFFGPNEAPEHGTADPYLDKLLDFCGGHTGGGGMYHFHVLPVCLFDKVDGRVALVVGYAFDGYPILAPFECVDAACGAVRKVRSSWRRENGQRNAWTANQYVAGHGDLDRCNGMIRPDGTYAYYATETFPYGPACYHGVASLNQPGMPGGGGEKGGKKGPPPGRKGPGQFPLDRAPPPGGPR
jgi:hypothetical protein